MVMIGQVSAEWADTQGDPDEDDREGWRRYVPDVAGTLNGVAESRSPDPGLGDTEEGHSQIVKRDDSPPGSQDVHPDPPTPVIPTWIPLPVSHDVLPITPPRRVLPDASPLPFLASVPSFRNNLVDRAIVEKRREQEREMALLEMDTVLTEQKTLVELERIREERRRIEKSRRDLAG